MRRILTITMVIVLYAFVNSWGTIINVPADYPTIQQGIDASSDGDTVLAQPGTYVENINFNGHNIVLGSLFLTSGDTSYISQTIIDGDDSASVVIFENGENVSTEIVGFSIINGSGIHGGGIYCDNSNPNIRNNYLYGNVVFYGGGAAIYCHESSSRIINNDIYQNVAAGIWGHRGSGGGIYIDSCENLTIEGNSIFENLGAPGGGIACYNSTLAILGNIIYDNESSEEDGGVGGGIHSDSCSNLIIKDNRIIENYSSMIGGGISCTFTNSIITHNTISENEAHVGGAISCYLSNILLEGNLLNQNSTEYGAGINCVSCDPLIINTIFYENVSNSQGAAVRGVMGSSPIIINSILWENATNDSTNLIYIHDSSTVSVSYSLIQDTLWPGEGNISADPLFRDPANSDFHLMYTICGDSVNSPCIDAGDPAILDSLLDCNWGMGWYRSDMGAYGGGDSITVGIDDYVDLLPDQMALMQNYPNPFNTQTTIRFILPEARNVRITIYDLLGREVRTLLDEYRWAGTHNIIFNISGLSSGVYFYRLQAGETVETKRMVLLK